MNNTQQNKEKQVVDRLLSQLNVKTISNGERERLLIAAYVIVALKFSYDSVVFFSNSLDQDDRKILNGFHIKLKEALAMAAKVSENIRVAKFLQTLDELLESNDIGKNYDDTGNKPDAN